MKKRNFGVRQQVEHEAKLKDFAEDLCAQPPRTIRELEQRKYAFAKATGLSTPLNRDLVAVLPSDAPPRLQKLIQKRSIRTLSGVTPIGILTKPYPCPGQCIYCPTEARMPKSYLKSQPAAARAYRNKFHPYAQVQNRILALQDSGHPVSKLEVIVMGGTWSFLPKRYQSWYIKNIFDAANQTHSHSLAEAQHRNETADRRVIGLTLETRPDFITHEELYRMRRYGCTRIEIGVQTLDDNVAKLTRRGHLTAEVKEATRLMRNYGFKICWHLMPGLPGSTPEKDLAWMQQVFEDEDCRPDFVKIYPCVVLETAELHTWWKEGRYTPLTDEELIKLLLRWKMSVPPWTRVMRLMRDIPVEHIAEGARFSNLRQILKSQPQKLREIVGETFYEEYKQQSPDWPCQCIRCREIGFQAEKNHKEPVLKRRDYRANGGKEVFLSYESPDESVLYALLRLRDPENADVDCCKRALTNAALIREVHSYGSEVSVGEAEGIGQHRGLGRKLIAEAERIARDEWGKKRITIIAGVGTREYYRKWGYTLLSTYMSKRLI